MGTYCDRIWLNHEGSASTGSVVAWHGETAYGGEKAIAIFFEVADCHCKARLHKNSADTVAEFTNKIRLLAKSAADFATFLESEYDL